jgi:dCTP deaminase
MSRASPTGPPTPVNLPDGPGVLASQHILDAIDEQIVHAGEFTIPLENVQPASLDLRLDEVAYRIQCSFLPTRESVERKVKELIVDEIPLHNEGVVLETNRPYLIPLKERLALPEGMRAKANPKSSTGRLDVFTRVITDGGHLFDEVADGYHGRLYLEVVPLSFPIRVREGLTLNQIRFSMGRAELDDAEIRQVHRQQPLVFRYGSSVPDAELTVGDGLFLSLDLRSDGSQPVGYRARDNAPLLDMTRSGPTDPQPYWEVVYGELGDKVVLTPERFYLLMSDEAVSIPPGLACEMTAYDPTSGELRTHYAGFFDPGFGFDPERRFFGSRAALEVRAHDVPFMIEHGQPICKLTFERMLEPPIALYGRSIRSSYQGQDDALGRHFGNRPVEHPPGAGPPSSSVDSQMELPISDD